MPRGRIWRFVFILHPTISVDRVDFFLLYDGRGDVDFVLLPRGACLGSGCLLLMY